MNPNNHSFQLSSGFRQTRASRLTALALLGVVGIVAAGCLGAMISMVMMWGLSTQGADGRGLFNLLFFGIPALFATAMAVWLVRNVLLVVRSAAWLDGTRLTVQRIRPRTVDLAAADIVALRPTQRRFTGSCPA